MQNRNWFYFEFSVESSSFIFRNFQTKKFKLTFEGWNRPVCHLFGFTRVSFCQNLLHFTLEANRDGADVESFPLFFSFSASFKNSSPREKVGNCLRFGTGGWSLCLYPLLSRNIWIFFPTLTVAACAKKNSGKAICSRNPSALSRFGARLRILNLSCSWVTNKTSEISITQLEMSFRSNQNNTTCNHIYRKKKLNKNVQLFLGRCKHH